MGTLVVGATGFVGGQVVRQLRAYDDDVSALVRGGTSHPKAGELGETGATIIAGDLTDPASLDRACSGIETVICTATSMPNGGGDAIQRIDSDGVLALIAAADRARVRKFVYVSYSGNLDDPSPLGVAKRTCEQALQNVRMQAVILRPSFFSEMWLSPPLGFDPANAKARVYGSGDAKVSYISAFNVADFAVATATREESGTIILEIGGPAALSQLDAVHTFERTLGRQFTLEHVPVEALEQQRQSPDPLQQTFASLMLAYAKGDIIRDAAKNAAHYGVHLHSVADYASTFSQHAVGA
jgi:uncharacterized protein YbjT (DUF2867 family)